MASGSFIIRRSVLLGGTAALLPGCGMMPAGEGLPDAPLDAPSTEPGGGEPPLRPSFDDSRALMPDITQALRVDEVTFRMAPDFKRTAPHNGVTQDFIEARMRETIVPGLRALKRDGVYPVRAEVELLRFAFSNVAVGIVVGAKGSVATFRTTLHYLDTGAQVGRPATNQATTPVRPTLLGVLAIKQPPEEVRIVARRAPEAIALRLFGRPEPRPFGL